MDTLLSNPALLILLAVVALAVFSGGSFNPTDWLLRLLRSLKLVPEAKPQASTQIYRAYSDRAFGALRAGDAARAKTLAEMGIQEAEEAFTQETAIGPQGTADTVFEWLRSPLVLIIIAVGVFLACGGMDGCAKKTPDNPQPQPQAEQVGEEITPAVWHGNGPIQIQPVSDSHYGRVMRAYQAQQHVIRVADVADVADVAPALPPEKTTNGGSTCTQADGSCLTAGPTGRAKSAVADDPRRRIRFWQRGPLRRACAALVRARPFARF